MPITDHEAFKQLCERCGITASYYDISGVHHVATLEARQSLLQSMRINVHNDQDIYHNLELIRLRDWQHTVAPVHVYAHSNGELGIALRLNLSQAREPIHWQIVEGNGQTHSGNWQFQTQNACEQCEINGMAHFRFHATLPAVSDIGYHRLNLRLAGDTNGSSLLIATPETCYQPPAFEAGEKAWGISLQLYTLRSKRNWGIGDFTDLVNAVKTLAPLGIDVIGLNPLHALFPHLPENASPYSPSSRDFLNPVYLDIEAIKEFDRNADAQQLVASHEFQARLQSLRDCDLVNYTGVWQAKSEVLKLLYEQFKDDPDNEKLESVESFRQYQLDGGKELFNFSLFEALQADFHQRDASMETWQQWPEAFHHPESSSVKKWADSNHDKIEFQQYLQWQAQRQLSAAQQESQQLGMRIGLYNDLAVGNGSFSSACWAEQMCYASGVGIGAPPDDFNLLGQNWGLPPQLPQALADDAYRLFIQTLRCNMRQAGALRIDHVMGLMRLYWVPEGYTADQGTYVSYPFDDLLGILALESQRNRCLIVGEDLGTVPDEVRHQLWLKRILSYRILFFEKDWQQGIFKPPHEYPQYALCTSGSHDLPTLKGYWQGSDLELRETLNLYPSEEIKHQQKNARAHDRYAIKLALNHEQLISDEALHDDSRSDFSAEIFLSIQRFLARSQSLLMMVQLEDLFAQINQLNVPGTTDEYPNWRHKVSLNLEDWLDSSKIRKFAAAISHERNQ